MGFGPREVDAMSLWEFRAASAGWEKAHSSGDNPPPAMSDDRLKELGIEGF
jgi:hypothetical protein